MRRLHGRSQATANSDSSSTQTRNVSPVNVFGTCAFRGITPFLLKSSIRKARNEFQLPALANIRSTSSTRDATDSKSRRFLETSGESYPRSLWLWHLVISRSAVSFLLCSMKIARRRVLERERGRERERNKNQGGEGKSREMKAVKKTRSRGDLFSRQKKVGKIARGSRQNGAARARGGRSSGGEYIPEGAKGAGGGGGGDDSTAFPPRFDDCIIDRVVIKSSAGRRCRSAVN